MNLSERISTFRSEVLMGRYDVALPLGKAVLQQLQILAQLNIPQAEELSHGIQEEYERCLAVRSIMRTKVQGQVGNKKWGNEESGNHQWQQKRNVVKSEQNKQSENEKKDNESLKQLQKRRFQQLSPVNSRRQQNGKGQHNHREKQMGAVDEAMLEFVQKELILPIRMPMLFKRKQCQSRILKVPKHSCRFFLEYLVQNGYTQLQMSQLQANNLDSPILIECPEKNVVEAMRKLKSTKAVFLVSTEKQFSIS